MMENQRSREWFLARKGRMTASEIYLLLNNRKIPMTEDELSVWKSNNPKSRVTTKEVPFSDGTFTWLNRKVAEYYMPDNAFLEDIELRQTNNKAIQHGVFWEDTARERYAKELKYEVFEVGFIPLKNYEHFAGGSPDGVLREENGIIEIKCAWNPEIHQDYLLFEKPEDLKNYNIQYYAQIQMNMLVTDTEFCDFVAFDPRTSISKQIKILRVQKDNEMCSEILQRISLAKDYYKERMEKLNTVNTIII